MKRSACALLRNGHGSTSLGPSAASVTGAVSAWAGWVVPLAPLTVATVGGVGDRPVTRFVETLRELTDTAAAFETTLEVL